MSDTKASLDLNERDLQTAIDPIAEKQLLKKLDWRFIPLFTLIYCTNFIDRTAIGNAKIAGIEKDLNMAGFDYNIALTVFYVSYIAAEVPSNLALKHFGPVWLAAMVIVFGVVAIGTAFVTSYGGLIATRVFLGAAEGGTLSGFVYLLSGYYRRTELVFRVGFMGVSTSLAGAFGGLLASGLLSVGDIGTVTSWRKIFLIGPSGLYFSRYIPTNVKQRVGPVIYHCGWHGSNSVLGIVTCGIGLILVFILPKDPRETRMFNEEERALALARIDADQTVETKGVKEKTTMKLVLRSFSFTTTICSIMYMLINISFQGLSLFMPTVVATLGHYTVVESQLRTVPPYLIGGVWAVVGSYCSLRLKRRAPFVFFSSLLMVAGYAIAVGSTNPKARYAACFLSIAGGSNSGPMVLVWGTANAAPDTVKAVATALIPGMLSTEPIQRFFILTVFFRYRDFRSCHCRLDIPSK
ncbi:hypothetical protein VNI00_000016 [Paramarasmius palmivorus]|uniref:Major facilitator superfamily (MFS) profile domain-containing protein n=1 Tax=Paramarasmius palmivorus TaxID=297713 RepID=A0AAW0EGN8_9AGAR